MKKFLSTILLSVFIINFSQNIFADDVDKFPDKTIPEITKIETVYSNKKWEFFIYWENFWKDLENIEVLVVPETSLENEEVKIKVENIYSSMLSWEIDWDYENWIVVVRKKIWENETVSSEKKFFDFWLPTLNKIEAEDWFIWGKKIIFTWENFKKPIYWIIWKDKIICAKESETSCEIEIPKDDVFSWELWIESYWFEVLSEEEVSVDKNATVEVSSYSSNSINFNIDWFSFSELRVPAKNQTESDLKEAELNSSVYVFIDWEELDSCTINISSKINCEIDRDIYKKWIWYIDFFWVKTSFFSYDLTDSVPYPTNFSKKIKWSSYQDEKTKETIEWNRIYLDIWIANFDYQKSSESWFWQSTKDDFILFFWWKEYSVDNSDISLSKDNVELILSDFPNEKQWEFYFQLWNIRSESVAYDFWEYIPEIYEVSSWDENTFFIEWKNLTNFNDLEASVRFWEILLSTSDIDKLISEKEKDTNEQIKKYEAFITKAEAEILEEKNLEFPDSTVISNYEQSIIDYRAQVTKYEWILNDLENWIYERTNNDNDDKLWWEIIKKSDTKIEFKIYDEDEYWKNIWKWEYKVTVTSNWEKSNEIDFLYDPNLSVNLEKAYPEIEKVDYPNWFWDPSVIEIKWFFLDRIKEIYFTDLKWEIVKKEKNKLLVNIDPAVVLRSKWTIIAKLDDLSMTSNLFFYEFTSDKSNNISLDWKKIEESDEEYNKEEEVFELILKNVYKNVVLKNLKIKIENIESDDLPFYNFYLNTPFWKITWIYDESKSTINFENTEFENEIEIQVDYDEDEVYEYELVFEKIKSWKWEVKISLLDLNFYDNFNFPEIISSKNISFVKTPKFYKVEDSSWYYCIEKNISWDFVKCWTEIWSNFENTPDSVFQEEVIKSDFKAPLKNEEKIANFIDVNSSQWFSPYVENLYQRWIIEWYWMESKTFEPLSTITRAESVKILLVAKNENIENLSFNVFAFEDVPEWHWAKDILEFAVRNKFLTPVKNFHLNNEITRWEAVKLITKFFWRTVPEYSKYSLTDLWEHWSSNHAEYLFQNWIISWVWETKEFKPNDKVTRSEFAKMISLAIDLWSK